MEIALVYMAAGLSSRFGGKIKQFARVGPNNETLIEYSLNQALPAGFTKIIFIVGKKTREPFEKMFGSHYKSIPVQYVFQDFDSSTRDKPWGTVESLCSIRKVIDCPFVVCNGDDIYGENVFRLLTNHLRNKKTNATIGYKLGQVLPEKGSVNRGIFEIDSDNKVKTIKEIFEITKFNLRTKNLSEESLCSMNIFAFFPEVLESLNEILLDFKKKNMRDRKVECLLPNEVSKLIERGKLTMELYPTKDNWFGITNPEDEYKVREELKKLIKNK